MLSSLVTGGADCGPINPLQQLSQNFPSTSTSTFQPLRPAPSASPVPSSSSAFAPQNVGNAPAWANDFMRFQASPVPISQSAVSGASPAVGWHNEFLRDLNAIPSSSTHQLVPPLRSQAPVQAQVQRAATPVSLIPAPVMMHSPLPVGMGMGMHMGMGMGGMMMDRGMIRPMELEMRLEDGTKLIQSQHQQEQDKQWNDAFSAIQEPHEVAANPIVRSPTPEDLSTTAKKLLEAVRDSEEILHNQQDNVIGQSNEVGRQEKFRKSEFFQMMRGLRDGSLVVHDDNVVPVASTSTSTDTSKLNAERVDVKGKGKAREPIQGIPAEPIQLISPKHQPEERMARNVIDGLEEMNRAFEEEYEGRKEADMWRAFQGDGGIQEQDEHFQMEGDPHFIPRSEGLEKHMERVLGSTSKWEESMDFEEDKVGVEAKEDDEWDPATIVGAPYPFVDLRAKTNGMGRGAMVGTQEWEWEQLMNDGEEEETQEQQEQETATKEMTDSEKEMFDRMLKEELENLSISEGTRTHQMHSHQTFVDIVDPIVQPSPVPMERTRSNEWLEKGLRAQENEREENAIEALEEAVKLDPKNKDAWIALAVSLTNENHRTRAYECVEQWITLTREENNLYQVLPPFTHPEGDSRTIKMSFDNLVNYLIRMVNQGHMANVIDPDVQIVLGILFNSYDEYEKASDCFGAALAVRTDDAVLYNRIGATLANRGRSEEAAQYYYKAIDLRPSYARARYNIALCALNLNQTEEAARQLVQALRIQMEEGFEGGVTSELLWDTLTTCAIVMNRSDLREMTDNKDLSGWNREFGF